MEMKKVKTDRESLRIGPTSDYNSNEDIVTTDFHRDVLHWLSLPFMEDKNMMNSRAWKFHEKLGGMEKISILCQQFELDTDGDGVLSDKELKEQKEKSENIISKSLDFSTNTGIVGALLFSVLFTSVSSPLSACDSSYQYFGDTGINVLSGFYYICIIISLLISLGLILNFVVQYIYVSSWMPTDEIKLWYLREKSPLVVMGVSSIYCIIFVALSIPCAVAVNIGPGYGLVAMLGNIIPLVTFIWWVTAVKGQAQIIKHIHTCLKEKYKSEIEKYLLSHRS